MYLLMLFLLNLIEYKNEKKSISLLLLLLFVGINFTEILTRLQ